jgi:hypothetical protein
MLVIARLCFFLLGTLSLCAAGPFRGASVPWTTYEAEAMAGTGTKLGPKYDPGKVETEASGQQCVALTAPGQYLEFTARDAANAVVVRYSLPDAAGGGGIDAVIDLYQNGTLIAKMPVTSRYSYLYGAYPFSNHPKDGQPRNFFDEARLAGLAIARNDTLRLQMDATNAAERCVVDFVDLETVPAPLLPPPNSLAATDPRFGAAGDGRADDTLALRRCIGTARQEGKVVWLPRGVYKITGDIDVPPGVTIQGAGMWHTTLTGDPALYGDAHQRVRLNGNGDNIHLADFAIVGRMNYRSDTEPNDGIDGFFGLNSTITRLWVEHTKTGLWVDNSSNLVVDGCRFRNTIADGVNFCVGMRNSVIRNCAARGTGDDGFAIWPATHAPQAFRPGGNVISHCTVQFPFLANGAAIYGGEGNRIEACRFVDVAAGCGILISTAFSTSDPAKNIDNNFSSTTVVCDCDLIRCGGYDPFWHWRGAIQLCLDRHGISGLDLRDLNIQNSLADGLSIVASEGARGRQRLTESHLRRVAIAGSGAATAGRHGLAVGSEVSGSLGITDSPIAGEENNSTAFTIQRD